MPYLTYCRTRCSFLTSGEPLKCQALLFHTIPNFQACLIAGFLKFSDVQKYIWLLVFVLFTLIWIPLNFVFKNIERQKICEPVQVRSKLARSLIVCSRHELPPGTVTAVQVKDKTANLVTYNKSGRNRSSFTEVIGLSEKKASRVLWHSSVVLQIEL